MTFALHGYSTDNKSVGDFLADGKTIEVLESLIINSGAAAVVKGNFCYVPETVGGVLGGVWGVAQNTPGATTGFVSLRRDGIWILNVDSQDESGNKDVGFGDAVAVNVATGVLSRDVLSETQQIIGVALPASTISGDSAVHLTPVLLLPPGNSASPMRGLIHTKIVEMDWEEAGEPVILPAAENPNGVILLSFFAQVTEAPVGSSEDQLIVTLADEDDNTLSVLTTTDTTPDAAGDIIQGTLAVLGASTGGILAQAAAGKALKLVLTQATSGGSPAGTLDCRALLLSLT